MKLTRVFERAPTEASLPLASRLELSVRALLSKARSEWVRPARARPLDFQDTQPSIRDTGPTPR